MSRRLSLWVLVSLAIHLTLVAGALVLLGGAPPPMVFVDLVHGFFAADERAPAGTSGRAAGRPRGGSPGGLARTAPRPSAPSRPAPSAQSVAPAREAAPPAPALAPAPPAETPAAQVQPRAEPVRPMPEPVPPVLEPVPSMAPSAPAVVEPAPPAPRIAAPLPPRPPDPVPGSPPAVGSTSGGAGDAPGAGTGSGGDAGAAAAGGGPRADEPGSGHGAGGVAVGGGPSAGTGLGIRDGSVLALAVPGDGGGEGAEYRAYYDMVRRRIHDRLTYPSSARRRGLSGTVEIEVEMAPTGAVAGVRLAASSSHGVLDQAAVDAARGLRRVPFPDDVRPRPLRLRLPIVFQLD